jgi:hypothetical protein
MNHFKIKNGLLRLASDSHSFFQLPFSNPAILVKLMPACRNACLPLAILPVPSCDQQGGQVF